MGMYSSLSSALSGMRATQAGLDLVGRNVANADVPGYIKKTRHPEPILSGDQIAGIRNGDVTRQLDTMVQRQMWRETSGAGYVDSLSRYVSELDTMFGQPGSDAGLDSLFSSFRASLEGLTASPESFSARDEVVRDAEALAQMLNQNSSDVQRLRLEAEQEIGDSVKRVNELLGEIEKINLEIGSRTASGNMPADLLDTRDRHIAELSELIDIEVQEREHGKVAISTTTGAQLLELKAGELTFDERGNINPQATYDSDESARGVGTVVLESPSGLETDLIKDGALRSGKIAGLVELRDEVLTEAQDQLDAMADAMARALSENRQPGDAVDIGGQDGFEVDTADMLSGDRVELSYTDNGETHRVTIVRVDDPDKLPLDDDATADPDDRVIGVDFSGGMAAVAGALDAELDDIDVSDDGDTLRFLEDGVTVDDAAAVATATDFTDGMGLPLFVDSAKGGSPYANSLEGIPQQVGFAERIAVNPEVLGDNTKLVQYDDDTPLGDPARPVEMLDRLTGQSRDFSPNLGIAGTQPYSGTVGDYVQRVVSHQGSQAADVERAKEAQDVVVAQIEERFSKESGVNVDEEMARLIELQAAYQANTRVVNTYRELLDLLMQM